jgi:hypothetical protein
MSSSRRTPGSSFCEIPGESWMTRTYLKLKKTFEAVIPAKAGIQRLRNFRENLDPGFRRDDEDDGI